MAVKIVPMKFVTADGQKFDDEVQANSHQDVLDAQDTFEAARRKLTKALAKTFLTADGKPFDLGGSHYRLVEGHRPYVQYISAWSYNAQIMFDGSTAITYNDGDGKPQKVEFSELYCSEKAAYVALVAVLEHQVVWAQSDLDKAKNRLFQHSD